MRPWVIVVPLLLAGPAAAQEDLTVLDARGETPPRRMLKAYLLAEAQKHFDERRKAVAALKAPDDVQKRQAELKAKFIEALGGFPEKTPLNAQVVGKGDGKGYRYEKVIYESRPSHHVTATLYLPDGKGPFPGVLMPIGHSANGKAAGEVQRLSILLATNGIAVLAYDPIGQGERRQLLDDKGKAAIPSSTNEHTLIDVGALLVGRCTATYRVWDGIRSLDYLAGRPEVDPKRLGCTGCSGGGTLTSYLMALDDRIGVAVPSCYITSLERLFATIGPQDGEQNIPGQVAFGLEHADFLTLRAPRPTLICCATRDFFDIQGTWTSFREAKRVYGLMGHGERVDLFESDSGHGYPKSQREAALRWMRRWLLKVDDAATEGDAALLKDDELRCTRTGQVLEDLKGRSVFDLNAELATELGRKRERADRKPADLLEQVRRLTALPERVPAAKLKESGVVERKGYRIRKLVFETEPGVLVPGLMFEKEKGDKSPLVLYVHGDGKAADAAPGGPIEKLMRDGNRVLAVDLRGLGETSPSATAGDRAGLFGADYFEAFVAMHLARPLLGQRVLDLLAVAGAVDEGDGVRVVALGSAGPAALHAAALYPGIKGLTLERSLISWTTVVRTPISHNQLTNVVPGALKMYDLPDLAAACAPRPLTIRGALDPAGKPAAKAALTDAYRRAADAYADQKAAKALTLSAEAGD
jgi:dienelactone hydrolase/pimeloyl-ACP methyl ester carboxylesterase